MAIPDYQAFMLPLLKIAADGKEHAVHDSYPELATLFSFLLPLIHLGSGMVSKVNVSRQATHDIAPVAELHPEFQPGDILVGDRAFRSYQHFCALLQREIHGVCRLHGQVAADFTPGRAHVAPGEVPSDLRQPKSRWVCALGKKDLILERYRPQSKLQWMSREDFEALPTSFLVREIQYRISQPGYRSR